MKNRICLKCVSSKNMKTARETSYIARSADRNTPLYFMIRPDMRRKTL